jgi:hypothetical protein
MSTDIISSPSGVDGQNLTGGSDSDYFLISFAPSSGIGFYHFANSIYQFDLVSGTDSVCKNSGYSAMLLEQDQVDARIPFLDLNQLKRFTRGEYLRDKKHAYLALILTQEIRRDLLKDILQFLNETDLAEIALSDKVRPVLYEIASIEITQGVLYEAQSFTNVLETFGRELPDLALEALRSILDRLSLEHLVATPWLSVLARVVGAAKTVPARIVLFLTRLVELVEASWIEIGPQGVSAVLRLAQAVGYESPRLSLRMALESESSRDMAYFFRQALSRISTPEPQRREHASDLRDLGHSALESAGYWTGEWGWPFPWRSRRLESSPLLQDCLQMAFKYRGSSFGGVLPNGLPFELYFAERPEIILREIVEERDRPTASILASRTAFWVAFLFNPDTTLSRLRPERISRYSWAEIAAMTVSCYERWGTPERSPEEGRFSEPASLWSVCYPDLVNFTGLAFVPGSKSPAIPHANGELEEVIGAIANNAKGREIRSTLGLPDPLSILVNNFLSSRFFEGDTAGVQTLRAVIARSPQSIEFTGLLRFVL